jgi:putative hydrolase of the HAD superfamily
VGPVLLFDLDETLVVEEAAVVAAFRSAAAPAAAAHGLDAAMLGVAARARARELWRQAPTHPYCQQTGISSWEGLWCRYEGDHDQLRALRAWAPVYRREAWRLALADHGVEDGELASELAERFMAERRARHEAFADARPALERLTAAGHRLGLVTNGAGCLQREKLAGAGLEAYFDAVVVSGELGCAKPDPRPFHHALEALGCRPEAAVMIGDSLARDIVGARAAGLQAIWLRREPAPPPRPVPAGVPSITSLDELPAALEASGGGLTPGSAPSPRSA